MPELITICEKAAREGGAVLLDWQGRFHVREKGPADLVTEADLAAQAAIRRIVLGAFPDHDFLGEEETSAEPASPKTPSKATGKSAYRWIVDPLDGTTNYVHGMPTYCVSVALERAGDILVGAIFSPVSGECFTAVAGRGAWLNGEPIRTSSVVEMRQALVAVSFPPRVSRHSADIARFVEVVQDCQAVRRLGSAALNLCFVAAGRLDAYWGTSVNAWDVAAGLLMVREAGGVFTAIDGGELDLARPRFATAATEPLHKELLTMLARVEK